MVDVVKLGVNRPANKPLLPDPEPREVHYTLFSVDDHLMEPADTFEGRVPEKYKDRAPKIVESDEGFEVWQMDGQPYFQAGFMCFMALVFQRLVGWNTATKKTHNSFRSLATGAPIISRYLATVRLAIG